MSLTDRLLAATQVALPTRLLSRAMHALAQARIGWIKNPLIRAFCRLYRVNLDEAEIRDPRRYASFNGFFTRALRPGARPLPADPNALACPVDSRLGAAGGIAVGRLFQAKGAAYTVSDLVGHDDNIAAPFLGGSFATLYLAPNDYHRVHMPLAGTLRETRYLPGRLFGVNPASVRAIPRLFTRNERLLCLFDTAAGPMAVVLVGAFCVGGIATVWGGDVTPPHRRQPAAESFPAAGPDRIGLQRGDELGRFNLGSTVILLFGAGAVDWSHRPPLGTKLRMGEEIGAIQ